MTTIFAKDNSIIIGTSDGRMYSSTDYGNKWINRDNGLFNSQINCILMHGNSIFAGTSEDGLLLSSDSGINWIKRNYGLTNLFISSLAIFGNYIIVGTPESGKYINSGIFMSSDEGNSWEKRNSGLIDSSIFSIAINNNEIFIGGVRIYLSTNLGDVWLIRENGLPEAPYYSIAHKGNIIFVGSFGKGVYTSIDNGNSWFSCNIGLPSYITSLAIKDDSIFAATFGLGIFRANINDLISDVCNQSFILNYKLNCTPNPIIDKVFIEYFLPKLCSVTIKISNSLGTKIAEVMSQKYHSEGTYKQVFGTSVLPSGVYFCTLQTPECTITKQFVVVK